MSEHEDLEDGEIEDDEEDVIVISDTPETSNLQTAPICAVPPTDDWDDTSNLHNVEEKVQKAKKPIENKSRRGSDTNASKPSKRSKPGPVVDDWATSVENAIANALKKDGVQPPMPSISNRHEENDGETPSKRKKRERQKKKSGPDKIDEIEDMDLEYEMMNVRGGSPRPSAQHVRLQDRSVSEESYSSDDSRDRDRERERDRERRDRDRDRDREYNRRKRKNRQRNRGNRDNRKRKRDESDDEKHNNRNSGPRKMELCKFYLMDCCAKREKCLYMHSDFPCKYYYLGLKCKEKEKCLFSHGQPLTDELRAILMKHLETAPQEILGDFPRISRESATTMVNATHRKLLDKFGMTDNKTASEGGDGPTAKIPSLLDMMGSNNDRGNKNRRSRWCDKLSGNSNKAQQSASDTDNDFLSLKYLTGVISPEQIANLEKMGIHNLDQISQLTVAQLNELGLQIVQINELQLNAINMKKLRENISKQGEKTEETDIGDPNPDAPLIHSQDQDMRITPAHTALPKDSELVSSGIPTLGGKDVDMRLLPLVNAVAQEAPNVDNTKAHEDNLKLVSSSLTSLIKTPTVDYSQYLKDSNLDDDDYMDNTENPDKLMIAHDDDEDDDDDEENNLKISLEDEEQEEKMKDFKSYAEDKADFQEEKYHIQPQPAVFDPKIVNHPVATQKIDYTKPFGMYKQAEEKHGGESTSVEQYSSDSESSKKNSETFNHTSMYSKIGPTENVGKSSPSAFKQEVTSPSNTTTIGWTPTGTTSSVVGKTTSQTAKQSRTSIYDDPYTSDDSNNSDSKPKASMYGERDKDMRLNYMNLDAKINENINATSDIDLRLPFKPMMTNYIPATEIEASIMSHPAIIYKVYEVDIPKPNYKDIRRNTPRPDRTKDPRLRRIFGMNNEDASDNNTKSDFLLPGIRSPKSSSTSSGTGPIAPRVDPRTKRMQEMKTNAADTNNSSSSSSNNNSSSGINNNPAQLDVQTILQRSTWYTDLSSKHKIMVNQQLAILSTEMKKYHNSDKSTDKLADFMQLVSNNQMLQFILTNLNVYVDEAVAFCEVPMVPAQPPPLMSVPPPNIGISPLSLMPPVSIPPPVQKPPSLLDLHRYNCPPDVRPGLLGVGPNMPFEQFLAMGQINKPNNPPPLLEEWNDDYEWDSPGGGGGAIGLGGNGGGGGGGGNGGGGGGFNPNFERNNNFNNVRNNNMRNNRGGNNYRNNERWNNSGGNNSNRRNNHRRMDKKK